MMRTQMIKFTLATLLLTSAVTAFAADLSVSKSVTVKAGSNTVWKMIGDFNHLDVWHPVVVDSKLLHGKDNTPGAERLLTLGNGATITEDLVSHNDNNKSYTYMIVQSPLPVKNYKSTISVSPAANGASKVTWRSTFDAKDVEDKKAVDTISGIYDAGLQNLVKHFNQ